MSVLVIFFFVEKLHVCLLLLLFFCMIHSLKSDSTIHPYFRLYCYPDEDTYTASKLSVTSTRNSCSLKCGKIPLRFIFCDNPIERWPVIYCIVQLTNEMTTVSVRISNLW